MTFCSKLKRTETLGLWSIFCLYVSPEMEHNSVFYFVNVDIALTVFSNPKGVSIIKI